MPARYGRKEVLDDSKTHVKVAPLLGFCLLDRVHTEPSPAQQLCWDKLIRRTLLGDHKIERALSSVEYWSIVRDNYKEKKVKVDANFPLLHLLEVICEKSPRRDECSR